METCICCWNETNLISKDEYHDKFMCFCRVENICQDCLDQVDECIICRRTGDEILKEIQFSVNLIARFIEMKYISRESSLLNRSFNRERVNEIASIYHDYPIEPEPEDESNFSFKSWFLSFFN